MRTEVKVKAHADGTLTRGKVDHSMVYNERKTCRACSHPVLQTILSLGTQYLVNFVPEIDLDLPKAPLELVRCEGCGLLQLRHTVNPDLLFRDFWYRSGINQSMRDAMLDIVQSVEKFRGHDIDDGGLWLDIGANDGYLLSNVPDNYTRIACEPARTFTEELHKIADRVVDDYFKGTDYEAGTVDVVTSAAMFYDVDEPSDFVAGIARILSPNGIWVNQLNDSPTMLKANAFDAICHEHLCYYDIHSLAQLYRKHGLKIVQVTHNDVNGGSIRVFASKAGAEVPLFGLPSPTLAESFKFASRVKKWKKRMTDLIHGPLATAGPLWLYGASTKGCVLLQYLEATASFRGIADRNPTKHGLRMAGTWLPVLPEDDMRAEYPGYVIALPWAFRNEFIKREREMLDMGTIMVFPLPNIEFVL